MLGRERFRLQHGVEHFHNDLAHLLDDVFQPTDALDLRGLGGLFALAEDMLRLAILFPP
jgi:hypothetical protein